MSYLYAPLGKSAYDDSKSWNANADALEAELKRVEARWPANLQQYPLAAAADIASEALKIRRQLSDAKLNMLRDKSNAALASEIDATGSVSHKFKMNLIELVVGTMNKDGLYDRYDAEAQTIITLPDLRDDVVRTVHGTIWGLRRLAVMADARPWFMMLGGVTNSVMDALVQIGGAIEEVKDIVVRGVSAVYEPLRQIGRVMSLSITIAKWSAVGLVAYWLFVKKKKKAPA